MSWEPAEKRKGGGNQLPPINNRKNNPVFENHLIEK